MNASLLMPVLVSQSIDPERSQLPVDTKPFSKGKRPGGSISIGENAATNDGPTIQL